MTCISSRRLISVVLPLIFIYQINTHPLSRRIAKSTDNTEAAAEDNSGEESRSGLLALLTRNYQHNDSDQLAAHLQQVGLLEYENQTAVEKLEQVITPESDVLFSGELPVNVYEVPLEKWTEDDHESEVSEQERLENNLQSFIRQAVRQTSSESTSTQNGVRHGTVRQNSAVANRNIPQEPLMNLPVENLSQDILNILESRRNGNQQETTSTGPLSLLRQREKFNVTVDYQEPFRNVDAPKLLEIVLLMRSDCTLLPKRIVRWVSGKRGILFECQNGAWVVRYLKRRDRKPRPVSVEGKYSFLHE